MEEWMKKLSVVLVIIAFGALLVFGRQFNVVHAFVEPTSHPTSVPTFAPSPTYVPTAISQPNLIEVEWNINGEIDTKDEVPMVNVPGGNFAWLQLVSPGIRTSSSAEICYPFRNYQFGWSGDIYHFVQGQWVKMETKISWPTEHEGLPTACTKASAAGEYALFGYYSK
jgi:hypothetical protein